MFVKLAVNATCPQRATPGSAGYDLAAYGQHILQPGINKIRTGVSVAVPDGYYGQIALRSGFSSRTGCIATAGVIDCDYRGEIMVMVISPSTIILKDGEKFSQLILIRIATPEITLVEQLTPADQVHLGFGSTDFKPKENIIESTQVNMAVEFPLTDNVALSTNTASTTDTQTDIQTDIQTDVQTDMQTDNIRSEPHMLTNESLNDFLSSVLQNDDIDKIVAQL